MSRGGLFKQIEEGNKRVYKAYTGKSGMDEFKHTLRYMHLVSTANMLKEWGEFTEEEHSDVCTMLGSDQDFVMGEMVIENKVGKYESNI